MTVPWPSTIASVATDGKPDPDGEHDPRLAVEYELMRREPIFHRPELGTTRADFEAQTAPDFWEVGASGRRYSRDEVLAALEARHAQPHDDEWETSDFRCREIGPDSYAVTYVLRQGERITRRLTLWRRDDDGWRILYHQGTIAETDSALRG